MASWESGFLFLDHLQGQKLVTQKITIRHDLGLGWFLVKDVIGKMMKKRIDFFWNSKFTSSFQHLNQLDILLKTNPIFTDLVKRTLLMKQNIHIAQIK